MSSVVESTPVETPYDEFNQVIPEDHFPPQGMSARAAAALVGSEAWTDCRPVMNLSSFASRTSGTGAKPARKPGRTPAARTW